MGPFAETLPPVITPPRLHGTGSLKISKISYYFPLYSLDINLWETCSLWCVIYYTTKYCLSSIK